MEHKAYIPLKQPYDWVTSEYMYRTITEWLDTNQVIFSIIEHPYMKSMPLGITMDSQSAIMFRLMFSQWIEHK
jgi:hypothetical protein